MNGIERDDGTTGFSLPRCPAALTPPIDFPRRDP